MELNEVRKMRKKCGECGAVFSPGSHDSLVIEEGGVCIECSGEPCPYCEEEE